MSGRPRRAAAVAADELREIQRALAQAEPNKPTKQTNRRTTRAKRSDDDDADEAFQPEPDSPKPKSNKRRKIDSSDDSEFSVDQTINEPIDESTEQSVEQVESAANKYTRGCRLIAPIYKNPTGFVYVSDNQDDPTIAQSDDLSLQRINRSGIWALFPNESSISMKQRENGLKDVINSLNDHFDSLLDESQSHVFQSIHAFINSIPPIDAESSMSKHLTARSLNDEIIYCGLVHAGVAVDDHPGLLQRLRKSISSPAHHVYHASTDTSADRTALSIIIEPSHCQRIEAALSYVLMQFMNHYPDQSSNQTVSLRSNAVSSFNVMESRIRRDKFLMKDLMASFQTWYTNLSHHDGTPPKLVLIIDQVDGHPPMVLNQLLYILFNQPALRSIRFVLLIGLTIDSRPVDDRISPLLIERMELSSFHLKSPAAIIDDLVKSLHYPVVAASHSERNQYSQFVFPGIIEPSAMTRLLSSYRQNHVSLSAWRMALHAMTIGFFSRTPGAALVGAVTKQLTNQSSSNQSSPTVRELIYQLPESDVSFLLDIALQGSAAAKSVKKQPKKDQLTCIVEEFAERWQIWLFAAQMLHQAALLMPRNTSLQQQESIFFSQLYSELGNVQTPANLSLKSISNSRIVSQIETAISRSMTSLPIEQIKPVIERWITMVDTRREAIKAQAAVPVGTVDQDTQLNELSRQLNDLLATIDTAQTAKSAPSNPVAEVPAPAAPKLLQSASKRRAALMMSVSTHAQAHLQPARDALMKFVSEFCSNYLPSLITIPGHNLFVDMTAGQSLSRLDHNFSSSLHRAIQDPDRVASTILNEPYNFDAPSVRDIALLYRLYKQSGRIINLYDMFKAFESEAQLFPANENASQVELQVRYMCAVEQLEWTGFLTDYKPRVDHREKTELVQWD